MKPIQFSVVVFFLFLYTSITAQHLDKFPTTANTLLWKIEGNKIKKDSYIFGTIHMIYKERFYFPDQLKTIIQNSQQVVLEIGDLNQNEVLQHLMLEKGTILDFFEPNQVDSLLNWAKNELEVTPEQFKLGLGKMKPFALVQLASQKDLVGKIESYDLTVQALAKSNEIPVLGLETIAQQIAIFDNMDTLQQREMIMELIRNPTQDSNVMEEMFTIYLKQNVDEMFLYLEQEGGSMMESSDALLKNRNYNWIPQIEKLIKKKKTFIAVGAGHLGGEDGVLRLLEKQGYILTPVMF